ncbi:TIGR03086 family metal-binding protein [Actinomadura flavalba]|uniref:TIGR03086 family metal-binding protein n=1 Tax=Actinomadura flavalba TaxID=1120938 RepID=UPI00035C3C8F|nr:TIGR03086 family metal-binding protein [Actinomadura flavalba]
MTADLAPAATRLSGLLRTVPDDLLDAPTPCPGYTLAALFDHVDGVTRAFTAAARKTPLEEAPAGDPARLGPDWRERIPAQLAEMAASWDDPRAWEGMTRAGGLDLPADVAGLVALDELVVHGWDVARAAGLPYAAEPAEIEACRSLLTPGDDEPERTGDPFGPPVPAPPDASELDRLIALAGRDPRWEGSTGGR